ncbi:MAG TPA: hypothetical protein VLA76_08950 [Candidatus Angelobacter sp.]|nr:hypothetical protein [Candidatus Angelobacter sp.]
MRLAFLTGALSAAFAASAITAFAIWILTVVLGSSEPWSVAPVVVGLVAVAFGLATYLAERIAHRRTLARRRATGEPWAFRER